MFRESGKGVLPTLNNVSTTFTEICINSAKKKVVGLVKRERSITEPLPGLGIPQHFRCPRNHTNVRFLRMCPNSVVLPFFILE